MEKMRIGSQENYYQQERDEECECDDGVLGTKKGNFLANCSSSANRIPSTLLIDNMRMMMRRKCSSRTESSRKSSLFLPYLVCSSLTLLLLLLILLPSSVSGKLYTNEFAVHVPAGKERADEIATRHGFINRGQIGSLENYYHFEHPHVRKRSVDISHEHHKTLGDEPDVHWFDQQRELRRVKRDFNYFEGPSGTGGPYYAHHAFITPAQSYPNGFGDPLFKEQWYLTSGSKDGYDMNVQSAWKKGITGKGVVVSILDDGIQTNHPDLMLNYDPKASTDINDNDNDPTPQDNGDNKHGTRCAGEVAATAGNNICGVGVAYNSSIGGVRMLDGTVNDAVEAKALGLNPEHVDIYSASWGPEDDGKTVDGPGPLARRAFIYGVTNGRRGLGSIFIWASGNGGRHTDSCNCDGYTNSIFTLSISSATQGGYKPWYLEECASTLATTYSSGTPTLDKSVATVDMDGRLRPDHICTVEHTGTSASAPLAAGIAALALEANRNLSWRDLQHLVVMTSRSDPLQKEEGWFVNGVNRRFSHKFGYGLMDAGAMVELAENWAGVPPQHICKSREIREDREIPGAHHGKVKVFMDVDGCAGTNSEIRYLEHVQCKISLRFFPRGNLRILLTSPMGTTSVLLFERPRDVSSSNFDDWPFLSVHFWGEQAHGRWTLEIINSGSRRINQPGILKKWQLILYGTDVNPVRYRSRSLNNNNAHVPTPTNFGVPSGVPSGQPQYRPAPPLPLSQQVPRFVPQDYLLPGASETVAQVQKPQMVRSQCKNEYWIPDLSVCVNGCPEGYFGDSDRKECLPCPQRCKGCYNSSSCTACEHNLVLFETSCVPVCPSGYYEADSSCELCQLKTCASCTGPLGSECVRCQDNLYLHENKCLPQCPGGFRPTEFGECTACPLGCHSCSESKCLVCAKGYELSEDKSSCVLENPPCPVGLYLEDSTNTCSGCGSDKCIHCLGPGECIQCEEGSVLYNGQCVEGCWDGLYVSQSKKECLKCPKLCTSCISPSVCTKCRGDGLLQEGRCLPHCSDGYFNDVGTCQRCSAECRTCIGGSSSDCISCASGYTLERGGSCVETNALTQSQPSGTGVRKCPDGFWTNSANGCQPCHHTCAKCNGGSPYNCKSCAPPLRLDRGSSRCIECCESADDLDCCHCDAKRHAQSVATPLTSGYEGECHFVSRRVSESSEHKLAPDSWSDSTVLSVFWLSVFIIFVAVIVSIQRRKRSGGRYGGHDRISDILDSGAKKGGKLSSSKSSIEYTPIRLREDSLSCNEDGGNDCSGCDSHLLFRTGSEEKLYLHHHQLGLSSGERRSRLEDTYEDYDDESSEGVPLVLNT